jgi:hypothetical protein
VNVATQGVISRCYRLEQLSLTILQRPENFQIIALIELMHKRAASVMAWKVIEPTQQAQQLNKRTSNKSTRI